MSLPTSGYTADKVVYTVGVNGLSGLFNFTVTVNVNDVGGESTAEDICSALEPTLADVAEALESVSGVTSTYVFKSVAGDINLGDIS